MFACAIWASKTVTRNHRQTLHKLAVYAFFSLLLRLHLFEMECLWMDYSVVLWFSSAWTLSDCAVEWTLQICINHQINAQTWVQAKNGWMLRLAEIKKSDVVRALLISLIWNFVQDFKIIHILLVFCSCILRAASVCWLSIELSAFLLSGNMRAMRRGREEGKRTHKTVITSFGEIPYKYLSREEEKVRCRSDTVHGMA